jgi:hypothetical protein
MATVQSKSSGETKSGSAKGKGAKSAQSQTDERDENYNLISVLYHALKGAETTAQYLRDAQQSGDDELVEFFEDTRVEQNARAAEAKRLLAERITDESDDDEDDEDDEDDD